jgi:hypothetical protein
MDMFRSGRAVGAAGFEKGNKSMQVLCIISHRRRSMSIFTILKRAWATVKTLQGRANNGARIGRGKESSPSPETRAKRGGLRGM